MWDIRQLSQSLQKVTIKKKKDAGTVLDKRDLRETTTKMQYVDSD